MVKAYPILIKGAPYSCAKTFEGENIHEFRGFRVGVPYPPMKTFTNFAVLESPAKVFSRKFGRAILTYDRF